MSVVKNSVKNCNRSEIDVTGSAWSDLGNLFVDQRNKLGDKLTKRGNRVNVYWSGQTRLTATTVTRGATGAKLLVLWVTMLSWTVSVMTKKQQG